MHTEAKTSDGRAVKKLPPYRRINLGKIGEGQIASTEAVPQYLQAFPTFGALDVVLPDGFEDQSNGSDDCPSFALLDNDGDTFITVFIDFKNPDDRREENPCRFHVQDHASGATRTTDEWSDVLDFVATHRPAASALERRQQEIEEQRAYEERFENSLESPEGGLLANIDND